MTVRPDLRLGPETTRKALGRSQGSHNRRFLGALSPDVCFLRNYPVTCPNQGLYRIETTTRMCNQVANQATHQKSCILLYIWKSTTTTSTPQDGISIVRIYVLATQRES